MSYRVIAYVKNPIDYENLMTLGKEILRFRITSPKSDDAITVVGKWYSDSLGISPNGWVTVGVRIWPEYDIEPIITVPLEAHHWSYTTEDDPREQVDVICDMAGNTYYITPAQRARYRALGGYRQYRDRLTLCVTPEAYYDDWDREYVVCGHKPEEHDENGCNHTIWDDYGSTTCGCEGYTKPAPLMIMEKV